MKKYFPPIALDLRSLAAFRIGLGLCLLGDLLTRALYLRAHYTDWGVLPRVALLERYPSTWIFSFHGLLGNWQWEALLFLVHAALAVALIIGFRTRVVLFFSWLLLISLQNRNPLILQGGDVLLRLLFFWALFLPLNARASVDAIHSSVKAVSNRYLSWIGALFIFQIALIYWFSAAFKTDTIWRTSGTAIYYALNIDQFTRPLGYYLLQFPEILRQLSLSVWYLEALGPFLLFVPFQIARMAAVIVFMGFHLGLTLTMDLGPFPYFCMIGWVALLPELFWDLIAKLKTPAFEERIAKIKSSFARIGQKYKPGAIALKPSRKLTALAVFLFLYALYWNFTTLPKPSVKMRSSFSWIGDLTRIDQKWNMFSPFPLKEDGWYVIAATLADGREVDLFTGGKEITWEKPERVALTYPTERWRKYLMNLWSADEKDQRLHYGRYLCRSWNESHKGDNTLKTFQIYFMKEFTPPPGKPFKVEKVKTWEHWCFEKDIPKEKPAEVNP